MKPILFALALLVLAACSNPASSSSSSGTTTAPTATGLAGVVPTLAGSTISGSTDGTGTTARFNQPAGVATDGTNLYVADMGNNNIRKVVIATAVVTTLAGSTRGSTDGTGAAAGFYWPRGMAISSDDPSRLFVTDYNNRMIRMIR